MDYNESRLTGSASIFGRRGRAPFWRLGLCLLSLLIGLPRGWTQGRTSTISGVVRDESGALIRGCPVTITNVDTRATRELFTGKEGGYRAPFLELGEYSVSAECEDFAASLHTDIHLELDREAVVYHTVTVGPLSETLTVTGTAQLVDASASAISSVVDDRKIRDLPLNGRDYIQLATLQAGTHVAREQRRDGNMGQGIQMSIAGSRPVQNNFRLDGVSLTEYSGSTPGSVNGLNLGVDAIEEFSILSSTYGAQYGRAAGGVINAVTRSGTNDYHGTLFYFHRNDNLDARNFFDPEEKPEFRRHQHGGSLGGPIVRSKTFFFVNYEGLREERGNTTIDTTLSNDARQGILTDRTVNVDPTMAEVVALYPQPNGEILGDTGLFVFPNNVVTGSWPIRTGPCRSCRF